LGDEKALGEVQELEIVAAKHHPSRFAVAFEVTTESLDIEWVNPFRIYEIRSHKG
jgi:hypothetical protein